MRALIVAALAALLVAVPASAAIPPPKMPSTTKGTKRCGITENKYSKFRVFVTKGKHRIGCRRAKKVVRKGINARGWIYYDWTKGGNPPFSDVWQRKDNRVVVAAIVTGY